MKRRAAADDGRRAMRCSCSEGLTMWMQPKRGEDCSQVAVGEKVAAHNVNRLCLDNRPVRQSA
jgi:hypothetical protein